MPEPTRPQRIADPDYPDLVHIEGGWSFPCKVVEITATMAPTNRAEGIGDLNATYEQTAQYVIRVRRKPTEITYMAGVSDEEYQRARQAVLESAGEAVDGQREPPGRVPTVIVGGEFTPEHRYVLRAWRKAHGQPAVSAGMPTAAEVNQAVDWWNRRQEVERG